MPNRDWLTLAKTSRARSKIRSWLNAQERDRARVLGRELVEKEFRKYKQNLKKVATDPRLLEGLKKLGLAELDDYPLSTTGRRLSRLIQKRAARPLAEATG